MACPIFPRELASATRPYMENRGAGFVGWHPVDKSMLVATRFGNTTQVHRVANPMGARKQVTFEEEPVGGAVWAPKTGDLMLVQKDIGGNEFYQIYRHEERPARTADRRQEPQRPERLVKGRQLDRLHLDAAATAATATSI